VAVVKAPFEYQWIPDVQELADAVLDDVLPPTCLSADLKSLDEAFIADDCTVMSARPAARQSLFVPQGRRASVALPALREEFSPYSSTREQTPTDRAVTPAPEVQPAVDAAVGKRPRVGRQQRESKADERHSLGGASAPSTGVPDTSPQSAGSVVKRKGRKTSEGGATKHVSQRVSLSRNDSKTPRSSKVDSGVAQDSSSSKADSRSTRGTQRDSKSESRSASSGFYRESPSTKTDTRSSSGGWTVSPGVSDSTRPQGKVQRQPLVTPTHTALVAGIDDVLRGTRGSSEAAELRLDTVRPGPLQLLSERLITAARRGDTDAIKELIDGGQVSIDVADSTGLTAALAASVRISVADAGEGVPGVIGFGKPPGPCITYKTVIFKAK